MFRQSGDGWEISYKDGKKCILKDTKGLKCIAHLLAKPHQSISVLALDVAVEKHLRPDTPYSKMSGNELDSQGLQSGDKGGDDFLDAEDKKQYRDRLKEIEELMEQARKLEDDENEAMLEAEKDEILAQLDKNTGLAGRSRKFSGDKDRVQSNLTKGR